MFANLLQAAEPIIQYGASDVATEIAPKSTVALVDIFMEGGWPCMAVITLVLVCALFAAWKAPAWVKSFGKVVLAVGVFSFLWGLKDMAGVCQEVGSEFPFSVYCGGFKVALIAPLYSIIVYVIITLVDMVRRPRI